MQAIRAEQALTPDPSPGGFQVGKIRIYAWIFGRLEPRKVPLSRGVMQLFRFILAAVYEHEITLPMGIGL